ncbi:envelope stress response membrane protein PspC [Colwellia sp. RSH04]|uniref:envelope stress response membrane protein PspC n=1 Tax=Colwellia sp. RSH04 TaxID=2305464 RepID=UPI000E568C3F|nr:envelope stress response membrane protein PspC [Colwellia sp. RSH04]RHW75609.1 envelope stress response membrane protein PspC [Colwellia sp. RSH04]
MNKRRGELYRNPSRGKIAGVCAGIADYFGWETWLVRILVVSGVLFGMPFLIFGYVAAWFILDKNPNSSSNLKGKVSQSHHKSTIDTDEEVTNESIKVKARIWQSGEPPKQAFHDIRRKFKTLEHKLQSLEKYVTSPEFTVSREINKL